MGDLKPVRVAQNEWYTWAPLLDRRDPREMTVKVDAKTARRWKAAMRAFERMTNEVTEVVNARLLADYEREARAAGLWMEKNNG